MLSCLLHTLWATEPGKQVGNMYVLGIISSVGDQGAAGLKRPMTRVTLIAPAEGQQLKCQEYIGRY